MTSHRRTALVAGIFYLVTIAASIPAVFLLDPVLTDPAYIVGEGADTQVLLGCVLDLTNALACIGTAVALYSVVRLEHEGLALGFVTTRMFEAAVIVIGIVCIIAIVTLRQDGAGGSSEDSLIAVGRGLVAVRDATFLIGPGLMPALNALLLGTLVYRSRLVPRLIPTMGLIGAPLLLSSSLGILFGINTATSVWAAVATLPILLWELSLGLWMTVRGFDPSAPILAGAVDPAGADR